MRCNETVLQNKNEMWLTFCLLWQEMMGLYDRKGQLYSHPVGHSEVWLVRLHDWKMEVWLTNYWSWNAISDETPSPWQRKGPLSLTSCWSMDEMRWDCMVENIGSVTHILWDEMGWTPHRIKVSAISLTFCWLAWSEMWWLWKKRCVTHSLWVMGDVMILHDRKWGGFYSLPIWRGVTHGLGLAEGRAAPLTYCWSWEWWSGMEKKSWQCHSQTVGHGRRCHETAQQNK